VLGEQTAEGLVVETVGVTLTVAVTPEIAEHEFASVPFIK
jgi:hypothetical protein